MTDPERPRSAVPLSRAGLARRYGVDRSAITRALQAAEDLHARVPDGTPAPPRPLNPGESPELFDFEEFDRFWSNRPLVGRPRRPPSN